MSHCKKCQAEYERRCKTCHKAQQANCRKSDPKAQQARQARYYQERKDRLEAKNVKNATPGRIVHYMDEDLRHREAYRKEPLACCISTLEY